MAVSFGQFSSVLTYGKYTSNRRIVWDWILRSTQILIIAILFAYHYIIGKIDLYGSFYEMWMLLLSSWLFSRLEFRLSSFWFRSFVVSSIGKVLFIVIFIDRWVVTIGFTFLSNPFISNGKFPLQISSLFLHFSKGLLLSMFYLEKLWVSSFLNFKFLFKILDFFFKTIEINLQLLLDSYMISNLCLWFLNCRFQSFIIFFQNISESNIGVHGDDLL